MQFFLVVLVIVLVWYFWRTLRRQQARVEGALKQAETSLAKKDSIELEKDPNTGVYRPRDREN